MTDMLQGQDRQVYETLLQLAGTRPDNRFMAALTAYEDARIDGLCHDGAWECALAALGPNMPEKSMAAKSTEK